VPQNTWQRQARQATGKWAALVRGRNHRGGKQFRRVNPVAILDQWLATPLGTENKNFICRRSRNSPGVAVT
jgi:hypothetical protein